MRRAFAIITAVSILLSMSVQAQTESEDLPPYLYYYSHLLGGFIVERADGTDSRHLATEALPLNLNRHTVYGPGWSASGRYFAAFGNPITVFDSQGLPVFEWLRYILHPISMHWSPGDEDLLVIFGGYHPLDGLGSFIWLVDVPNQTVLAEIGMNLDFESPTLGHIQWDWANERVVIDMGADMYSWWSHYDTVRYHRVILQFDGTTIKLPITREEIYREPLPAVERDSSAIVDIRHGISTSPSGLFEIYRDELTNTVTGEKISLPRHSQSTICRKYLWSPDEKYIITISGTLRAGGGCGIALIGVTDIQGNLRREIGVCSWDEQPACVGWLPTQVNVSALPPGQSQSVLLEPVRYDADQYLEGMYDAPFRADCQENDRIAIVEKESEEISYVLDNIACPFRDDILLDRRNIQVTYLESHDLLATYVNSFIFAHSYVHIWKKTDDGFELLLRLNAEGYELEFTEDGQYLQARNVHAWKVYAVKEILKAIQAKEAESQSLPGP